MIRTSAGLSVRETRGMRAGSRPIAPCRELRGRQTSLRLGVLPLDQNGLGLALVPLAAYLQLALAEKAGIAGLELLLVKYQHTDNIPLAIFDCRRYSHCTLLEMT